MDMVSLAEAKAFMNISGDTEDVLIDDLLAAAEVYAGNYIGVDLEEEYETLPRDIELAIKQIVAHWYENREATIVGVSIADVPMSAHAILAERRVYSF